VEGVKYTAGFRFKVCYKISNSIKDCSFNKNLGYPYEENIALLDGQSKTEVTDCSALLDSDCCSSKTSTRDCVRVGLIGCAPMRADVNCVSNTATSCAGCPGATGMSNCGTDCTELNGQCVHIDKIRRDFEATIVDRC
jgi:hypothetical protein